MSAEEARLHGESRPANIMAKRDMLHRKPSDGGHSIESGHPPTIGGNRRPACSPVSAEKETPPGDGGVCLSQPTRNQDGLKIDPQGRVRRRPKPSRIAPVAIIAQVAGSGTGVTLIAPL